jgi:hypothetical protein
MPFLGPLLAGLAIAADGGSEVRVSASGNTLAVVAQRAPLSAVLEEIGRQSGTSVAYDGAAPATPLTCDFVATTPGEAFVRALEGLGLNYVLYGGTLDVPRILLISGQSTAARTSVATAGVAARSAPAVEVAEEPDPSDGETPTLPTPPEAAATPRRFDRRGQGPATSDGRESDGRPATEPGVVRPLEGRSAAEAGQRNSRPDSRGRAN